MHPCPLLIYSAQKKKKKKNIHHIQFFLKRETHYLIPITKSFNGYNESLYQHFSIISWKQKLCVFIAWRSLMDFAGYRNSVIKKKEEKWPYFVGILYDTISRDCNPCSFCFLQYSFYIKRIGNIFYSWF